MVVVAVLSVAAAIFVPRFLRHQVMMRQEECHKNLHSLYQAEKQFFERKGVYTDDFTALAWTPSGGRAYSYEFVKVTSQGYVFACHGNIDRDPTVDEASIRETGEISQTSDDVRR